MNTKICTEYLPNNNKIQKKPSVLLWKLPSTVLSDLTESTIQKTCTQTKLLTRSVDWIAYELLHSQQSWFPLVDISMTNTNSSSCLCFMLSEDQSNAFLLLSEGWENTKLHFSFQASSALKNVYSASFRHCPRVWIHPHPLPPAVPTDDLHKFSLSSLYLCPPGSKNW